eukprot:g1781.t1
MEMRNLDKKSKSSAKKKWEKLQSVSKYGFNFHAFPSSKEDSEMSSPSEHASAYDVSLWYRNARKLHSTTGALNEWTHPLSKHVETEKNPNEAEDSQNQISSRKSKREAAAVKTTIIALLLMLIGKPLDKVSSKERELMAVSVLKDVVTGRSIIHKLDKTSRNLYSLLENYYIQLLLNFTVFCLIMLTLYEHSVWWPDNDVDAYMLLNANPPLQKISDPFVVKNDKRILHPYISLGIELLLLMPHIFECMGRWKVACNPWNEHWVVLKLVVCFLTILDVGLHFIYAAAVELEGERDGKIKTRELPHPTRFLRGFLCFYQSKRMRAQARKVLAAVNGLKSMMTVLFAIVLVTAVACINTWPKSTTLSGQYVFPSLHESVLQLTFMIFGSVNFPDVMLPAYLENSRGAAAVFVLFLVVGLVFVLNQSLAIVYVSYMGQVEKQIVKQSIEHRIGMLIAFRLLDVRHEGHVYKENFGSVLAYIRNDLDHDKLFESSNDDHRQSVNADKAKLDVLWESVDWRNNGAITCRDFLHTSDVLLLQLYRGYSRWAIAGDIPEIPADWKRGGACRRLLRPVVLHWSFGAILDIAVLLSLFNTFASAYRILDDTKDQFNMTQLYIETGLAGIFLGEMIITILAIGVVGYWKTPSHVGSGILVAMQLIGLGFYYAAWHSEDESKHGKISTGIFEMRGTYPGGLSGIDGSGLRADDSFIETIIADSSFIMILQTFRVARLVRLTRFLRFYENFNSNTQTGSSVITLAIATSREILPYLWEIAMCLFCIMFIFGIVGMEWFGGRLTLFNEDQLKDTSFWQSSYMKYTWAQPKPKVIFGNNSFTWSWDGFNGWPDDSSWSKIYPPQENELNRNGEPFAPCNFLAMGEIPDDDSELAKGFCYVKAEVRTYIGGANFNNMASSALSLFILLIVNNWHVLHGACIALYDTSEVGKWTVSAFFVSFHILSVLVVLNILISTFLDHFLVRMRKAEHAEAADLKRMRQAANKEKKKRISRQVHHMHRAFAKRKDCSAGFVEKRTVVPIRRVAKAERVDEKEDVEESTQENKQPNAKRKRRLVRFSVRGAEADVEQFRTEEENEDEDDCDEVTFQTEGTGLIQKHVMELMKGHYNERFTEEQEKKIKSAIIYDKTAEKHSHIRSELVKYEQSLNRGTVEVSLCDNDVLSNEQKHAFLDISEADFAEMDCDGNANVSAQELADFFARKGCPLEIEKVRRLIEFADTNNDGALNVLEFIASIKGIAHSSVHEIETESKRELAIFKQMFKYRKSWVMGHFCRYCNKTLGTPAQALVSSLCPRMEDVYTKQKCFACLSPTCTSCSTFRYVPNMCLGCVRRRPKHKHSFVNFTKCRICHECYDRYTKSVKNSVKGILSVVEHEQWSVDPRNEQRNQKIKGCSRPSAEQNLEILGDDVNKSIERNYDALKNAVDVVFTEEAVLTKNYSDAKQSLL